MCHQWLQTGACTLSYCRFQHFNPQAAYPNLSKSFNPNINKQNTIKNDSKWTMGTNDRRTKVCFQFRDLGYCTYGRICKFTYNSHSDSHIPMHISAYNRKQYSILINPVFVLILKILVVVNMAEGVNKHTLQMEMYPIL